MAENRGSKKWISARTVILWTPVWLSQYFASKPYSNEESKTNCSWPSLFQVVKIGKLKFKFKSTTFKFGNVSHGHDKNQPEKTKKSKNQKIKNRGLGTAKSGCILLDRVRQKIHTSVCIEHRKLPGYFLMNVECRTKAVKKRITVKTEPVQVKDLMNLRFTKQW